PQERTPTPPDALTDRTQSSPAFPNGRQSPEGESPNGRDPRFKSNSGQGVNPDDGVILPGRASRPQP
ncbi:hypothetical protein, partial [Vreelandella rituensis]|uniref:hypothetical protein n=1 Tax=Vreelandella rituensis TaxID=2282306 RepID=UPI0039EEE21B